MTGLNESHIEEAAFAWLESLGFTVKHGPEIAPGELAGTGSGHELSVFKCDILSGGVRVWRTWISTWRSQDLPTGW